MDEKVVGRYQQAIKGDLPYFIYSPPYSGEFQNGKFLDFDPPVKIYLHNKAKLTDFLDRYTLTFGIVVNERVKNALANFHLPPHKYHPIKVFQKVGNKKEVVNGYFWMHYYNDMYRYADLNKTCAETYLMDTMEVLQVFPIESESKLVEIHSGLAFPKYMRMKDIYFNTDFPQYDLFNNTLRMCTESYMSEELVSFLKENQFTGIDFKEAQNLFF